MTLKKLTKQPIQEERDGVIKFKFVANDGQRESWILLTGLKVLFQRQLPNMPKEYISRLVYDPYDRTLWSGPMVLDCSASP